ncbi:MAG TPA: DinB family protein [Patescibacteria group bacterium]|nr:DinB family protein [Patescibacteria group bacterium]
MSETARSRSAGYALEFERAQDAFISFVSSLSDEQWRMVGKNHPQRLNDEDEGRTVGVIAHHVAESERFILDRIYAMLEGRTMPRVDFKTSNAAHAVKFAAVTQDDVIKLLRENRDPIAEAVAAIPDESLDQMRDTPVGPMSIAQRLERVLIGHLKQHQGSIQATIS